MRTSFKSLAVVLALVVAAVSFGAVSVQPGGGGSGVSAVMLTNILAAQAPYIYVADFAAELDRESKQQFTVGGQMFTALSGVPTNWPYLYQSNGMLSYDFRKHGNNSQLYVHATNDGRNVDFIFARYKSRMVNIAGPFAAMPTLIVSKDPWSDSTGTNTASGGFGAGSGRRFFHASMTANIWQAQLCTNGVGNETNLWNFTADYNTYIPEDTEEYTVGYWRSGSNVITAFLNGKSQTITNSHIDTYWPRAGEPIYLVFEWSSGGTNVQNILSYTAVGWGNSAAFKMARAAGAMDQVLKNTTNTMVRTSNNVLSIGRDANLQGFEFYSGSNKRFSVGANGAIPDLNADGEQVTIHGHVVFGDAASINQSIKVKDWFDAAATAYTQIYRETNLFKLRDGMGVTVLAVHQTGLFPDVSTRGVGGYNLLGKVTDPWVITGTNSVFLGPTTNNGPFYLEGNSVTNVGHIIPSANNVHAWGTSTLHPNSIYSETITAANNVSTANVNANTQVYVSASTNFLKFGGTNSPPANTSTVRKWISVQVNGETNAYRLPLYE